MLLFADLAGPATEGLVNLLKYGQFGAAVAMLLLGFYLSWDAQRAPLTEIPARKGVAFQFMSFAVLFFVLCSAAEIVKPMLPQSHAQVNAMIAVPPLDDQNYQELGEVQIVILDGEKEDKKRAWDHPQLFSIHDGASFTISLNGLVAKLKDVKTTKQVIENNLAAQTPDLGPSSPK